MEEIQETTEEIDLNDKNLILSSNILNGNEFNKRYDDLTYLP